MDSLSTHSNAFTVDEPVDGPGDDLSAMIGVDERRMHVRAYNYWVSLLESRDFPSIEDFEPDSVADFAPHSVLLDFTAGRDNPATPYIGSAIRGECGLSGEVGAISDVPSRSLLSRLTDHYLQIIANRAPIGFEAEFVNQRGASICYRGILMPLSSDGDTIDFIYGVINWKEAAETAVATDQPIVPALAPIELAAEAALAKEGSAAGPVPHLSWQDGPLHDAAADPDDELTLSLDDEAGLADRLSAARDSAEVCKQHDGRSRAALYRALAMAYDFAVAARRATADYAEILEDAGVKAQARAPMTPIVKLVFGIDYDKTRLTEFAAALSFAERSGVDFGAFLAFIEGQPGGLKALVAGERTARRPASAPEPVDPRLVLRGRPAMALADLPTNQEYALVLTRRNAAGVHEIVSVVSDDTMLERALRRSV
ncbi:hypothetical protein [Sphingomonas sp.]|uniref:PAS domain-containing protein n=1 Tax=Sphingomonas sp. TaxID=28214 RepID=UPI00325FA97A